MSDEIVSEIQSEPADNPANFLAEVNDDAAEDGPSAASQAIAAEESDPQLGDPGIAAGGLDEDARVKDERRQAKAPVPAQR